MKTTIVTKVVSKRVTGTKIITTPFPRTVFTYKGLVPKLGLCRVLFGIFSGFHLGSLVLYLVASVALVAFFRKKDDPKPVKQKQKNITKINDQRYVIRRRDEKGRLRHIETVNAPPDKQYLKQFGPGNYCILTSKPKIALWNNFSIPKVEVNKIDKSKSEDIKPKTRKPPSTSKPKPVIEPIFSAKDIKPQKHLENRGNHIKKKNRKMRKKKRILLSSPPDDGYKKRLVNNNTYEPKLPVQLEEEIIENTDINPINQDFTHSPQKIIKAEIKKTSCSLCNDTSGVHVICEFCGKLYCKELPRNCYNNHSCGKSMQCHYCNRRIQFELIELNEYCHNSFCSQRCMDLCYQDNKEEPGCKDCNESDSTESECLSKKDEDMSECGFENILNRDYECKECGASVDGSMIYCPSCGLEFVSDRDDNSENIEGSDAGEEDLLCDECRGTIDETDKFCPHCGMEFEKEGEEEEEYDCDGDCGNCTSYDCEDRCRRRGRCKGCRDYKECEIRCEPADEECEKEFCKGFRCKDRATDYTDEEREEKDEE